MSAASVRTYRMVAWCSILSFPACGVAMYTFMAAVNFDTTITNLPVAAIGEIDTRYLVAWGIFDILGYYLMRVPLILFLWRWLRSLNPIVADTASIFALLYIFLAISAASLLTGSITGISEQYQAAAPALRVGLESAWIAAISTIYRGLWQFNLIPWLFWGLAMGALLKSQRRFQGLALQAVGLASMLSVVGLLCENSARTLLSIVDTFQVNFMPLWMAWVGIALLRNPPVQLELNLYGDSIIPAADFPADR